MFPIKIEILHINFNTCCTHGQEIKFYKVSPLLKQYFYAAKKLPPVALNHIGVNQLEMKLTKPT